MFHSPARRAGIVLAAALALASLGACSSVRSFLDPANIEYRGATQGPELDVPPDLVTPQGSERYALPDRSSSQTLSEFQRERAAAGDAARAVAHQPPITSRTRSRHDFFFGSSAGGAAAGVVAGETSAAPCRPPRSRSVDHALQKRV